MSAAQLIQEWQEKIYQKYDKKISKETLIKCISDVSKKHNISIEDAIYFIDKMINQNKLGHLQNFEQSCYMDSVLFSLLAVPNVFVEKMLRKKLGKLDGCNIELRTKIQQEMREIKKSIIKGEQTKCVDFRKLLANCQVKGFEDFSKDEPRDADEFLKFIFRILEVENNTTKRLVYGTNTLGNISSKDLTLTTKTIDKTASPVFDIDYYSIKKGTTQEFLKIIDDSGELDTTFESDDGDSYKRRIQITQAYSYDYLVLNFQRLGTKFNNQPIIPSPDIILGNGKSLSLNAIVVWEWGHYTSFIKCDNEWWFFNDIGTKVSKIGSYFDMIKISKVLTNSTLIFYS